MSKPVELQVFFATEEGILETLEGNVAYKKGDAIVTGVKGEKWPIAKERFFLTYKPDKSVELGQNGVYVKVPKEVWALELDCEINVPLAENKGVLHGYRGDYLVQYTLGDYSIVNHDIFLKTYDVKTKKAPMKNK